MPMLHGVLVRSALAVALRWIVPPTWNVELPAIPTESHVIEKWSDTPQMSGFENVAVGLPIAATIERLPLAGWVIDTVQLVPWPQSVMRPLFLGSKLSS